MGWKKVKEHYRIKGIVRVQNGKIWVGNAIFHDEIVIDESGTMVKSPGTFGDAGFAKYAEQMRADPDTLRGLVLAPDQFSVSIPVYCFAGADILEKYCEALGYPNVTHDGDLMYDNCYSADRGKVVEWAKADAQAGIKQGIRAVAAAEAELRKLRETLAEDQANLVRLQHEFPESAEAG